MIDDKVFQLAKLMGWDKPYGGDGIVRGIYRGVPDIPFPPSRGDANGSRFLIGNLVSHGFFVMQIQELVDGCQVYKLTIRDRKHNHRIEVKKDGPSSRMPIVVVEGTLDFLLLAKKQNLYSI